MSEIGRWLESLGLGHFAATFADAAIDLDVLPEITEGDLEKLGMPLGHRKRVMKAIAALGEAPSSVEREASAAGRETTPAVVSALRSDAERRQLTVMFVDLVGSTAISARLDPEDMRDVIRAYQDACAGVITRFEGHVAKYMGDGVLAYFGWPRAHEDEAERAVRAGLDLVHTIATLKPRPGMDLAARVGIATGLVVVGDLIGEGSSQEQAVVGETPNLAARLQGLAQPGQVVIAATTRRLLGAGFEVQNLGRHDLKGLAGSVEAFGVEGERPLESRFEARSGPSLLPMVGRDKELALLLDRWAQAEAGEGQGVLLVGEAGIGKSRIVRALLDGLADEPHTRVRYQCSPYHGESAFWPVIQQLVHAAEFAASDPYETNLDRLEALLGRAGDAAHAAPLLAALVGLDGTSRYGKLGLTPEAQRARTLEALADQLLGLATRQPVLMVFEDAHWIDPTTLELIEQCLERIADARVLLLLTTRPDQQPELAAHPHVTRLTLNRLGRSGVEAIVARLRGDAALPAEALETIVSRTDGVPLFVEELTKSLVESGLPVDPEKPIPPLAIPSSLHDSLMARLDRIPEVKEIAQMAAVIGRRFDYAMLAAIADRSEADLRAALQRLVAAGLAFCRGSPPEAIYTFKHALVRDAAYASCLNARKRELHAKVAAGLEALPADVMTSEPATLAYHYGEAGCVDQAVSHWLLAGRRAVAASAHTEAIRCLEQGAQLLERMSRGDRRDSLELELLVALGAPMIAERGQASPEVEQVYSRALELARRRADRERLITTLQGLGRVYLLRPDLTKVDRIVEELESVANDSDMAAVCRLQAQHAYFAGLFRESYRFATRGVQLSDFDREQTEAFSHGMGHGLVCMAYRGCNSVVLGYPTRALAEAKEAIAQAEKVEHPYTLAHNVAMMSLIQEAGRDVEGARTTAESLLQLASRYALPQWNFRAEFVLGWVDSHGGESVDAVARMTAARSRYNERIGVHAWPHYTGLLVEALIRAGDLDRARHEVDEALDIATRSGLDYCSAELHRVKAQILLRDAGSEQEGAPDSLRSAIEIAQDQRAKLFELRAANDLARLWAERGERQKALDLLAPIYDWFTEGFDTADLMHAKALLHELR